MLSLSINLFPGGICGLYIGLLLLPPKANVLAIPIAPIASKRSASWTHLPSSEFGIKEPFSLNDTSLIISQIQIICFSGILHLFKNIVALSFCLNVFGDNFLSSTSCKSAASWTIIRLAFSTFAIFVAILKTRIVW